MLGAENKMLSLNSVFYDKELKVNEITHHTSIMTLLKIIQSKSIKFNRIDNLNDLEEKTSLLDEENYRRVFVSCFSLRKIESIPMWKIYTQANTGVMIKIKFRNDASNLDLFQKETATTNLNDSLPIFEKGNSRYINSEFYVDLKAFPVQYKKSHSTGVVYVPNENKKYNIPENFALEKGLAWKYEKEIRYRAIIDSFNAKSIAELPDYNSLFFQINFSAIEELTIIFNPWTNREEWIDIINAIKAKSNITTKFYYKNSSLKEKIRL